MMQLPTFLLKDTITVEKLTGYGESNKTFGKAEKIKCDVKRKQKIIITKEGVEIISSHTIIAQFQEIPADSKVTFDGAKYRVIETRPVKYLGRETFMEILIQ
jgi:hypothetical protein